LRLAAKRFGNRQEVRLVRFEKAQQGSEQSRVANSSAQFLSPDSGQIEESLRPTLVAERCRQSGEGESHRIVWVCARHRLHQ
jgi:hypothetical protein